MRKAIASIGILLGVVLGAWAQQASDLDLIRQLGGPDSRRASAELIRRGEAAVPALLTAATGSDTARAVRACQILGEIADSSALEPMLSLITNQEAQISDAAAAAADDIVNRGLQKLRDAIDQAPTKEDLDELRDAIVRVQDLRHILGMGRYTARVARECASNNPVIVRKLVSDVLSESGETDYRPLEDEELFVCGTGRWRPDEKAIEYVGQRCPDQLLEQLASSRCRFKAFVAEHLPPETLALASPYLLAMAVDPNPRRRLAAVEGLGSSPDLKAKDVLLAALNDPYHLVRAAACRSLSELGATDCLDALMDVYEGPSKDFVLCDALGAAIKLDPKRTFDRLGRCLGSADPDRRARTYEALADIDRGKALPYLIRGLRDCSASVRSAVVEELARDKRIAPVDELCKMLVDAEGSVKVAACEALSGLGDERAIAFLRPLCKDPDKEISAAAKVAIATLVGSDSHRDWH